MLRYRCHLLELVVKNLYTPILESAIVKIVNGDDLSSAKKLIVKSVRDVYVWKQSGYGDYLLLFFLPRLFWYQISLTKRACLQRDLIGPDQVRRRSSGMIGMAPGPFRELSAAYGPGLNDRFHVFFAECLP